MKFFVASPVEIYNEEAADSWLASTNDSRFLSDDGILRVDEARWQQAQLYERDTWLKYNLEASSDRNEEHRDGFEGYKALPVHLGHYLELGCGPFTNTRFILDGRSADSITLLDPLAHDYQREHSHCTYRDGSLNGQPVTVVNSTIERYKPRRRYDMVVMINVLPHCFDAPMIFDAIVRMTKAGGYLVFHEAARTPAPFEQYDVGHPLVVGPDAMERFLGQFEPIYQKGHYFIGRKATK